MVLMEVNWCVGSHVLCWDSCCVSVSFEGTHKSFAIIVVKILKVATCSW